jgi:hypothetical protein
VRALLAPVLKDCESRCYGRRPGSHEPAPVLAVSSSLTRACAGACSKRKNRARKEPERRHRPHRAGGAWAHGYIVYGRQSGWVAHVYDHVIDDLQSTFVPATTGQQVVEIAYDQKEGAVVHWYVPVVAWQLNGGDMTPLGVEGKIADGSNTTWVILNSHGGAVDAWATQYETLDAALQDKLEDFRRDRAKAEKRSSG